MRAELLNKKRKTQERNGKTLKSLTINIYFFLRIALILSANQHLYLTDAQRTLCSGIFIRTV